MPPIRCDRCGYVRWYPDHDSPGLCVCKPPDRSVLSRAQRVLDKLDSRLGAQPFHRHADRPSCVAIVTSYTPEVAHAELQLAHLQTCSPDWPLLPAVTRRLARSIAAARRILAMHLQE